MMSHPKGGQGRRGAPSIIIKGRGWGADYVNVALQNTVSPRTVFQNGYTSTSRCSVLIIHTHSNI